MKKKKGTYYKQIPESVTDCPYCDAPEYHQVTEAVEGTLPKIQWSTGNIIKDRDKVTKVHKSLIQFVDISQFVIPCKNES